MKYNNSSYSIYVIYWDLKFPKQKVVRSEYSNIESKTICIASYDILNTIDSVSLGCLNTEKKIENTTRSGVFLTKFEAFGYVVKHWLECLIYLLSWKSRQKLYLQEWVSKPSRLWF